MFNSLTDTDLLDILKMGRLQFINLLESFFQNVQVSAPTQVPSSSPAHSPHFYSAISSAASHASNVVLSLASDGWGLDVQFIRTGSQIIAISVGMFDDCCGCLRSGQNIGRMSLLVGLAREME